MFVNLEKKKMVQWFLKEVWLIKTKFGFISRVYKGQELVTRSVQQALCMTLSRDLVHHKKKMVVGTK